MCLILLENFDEKEEVEELNGDDVPLAEEMMGEIYGEELEVDSSDDAINGDNFESAVLGSNREMLMKVSSIQNAAKSKKKRKFDAEKEDFEFQPKTELTVKLVSLLQYIYCIWIKIVF